MRTSVEVSFKFDEVIQHPMRGTAVWVVRVASRTSEQFFGHASAGTHHDLPLNQIAFVFDVCSEPAPQLIRQA